MSSTPLMGGEWVCRVCKEINRAPHVTCSLCHYDNFNKNSDRVVTWICKCRHRNLMHLETCEHCGDLRLTATVGYDSPDEPKLIPRKTTRQDFNKILDTLFAQVKDMNLKKGNDYAGNEDVLRNFKENAERIGITKEVVWAVYFNKHYDALMTFIKDGELKSEPVEGRVLDMIVYLCLFYGMLCEDGRLKANPIL